MRHYVGRTSAGIRTALNPRWYRLLVSNQIPPEPQSGALPSELRRHIIAGPQSLNCDEAGIKPLPRNFLLFPAHRSAPVAKAARRPHMVVRPSMTRLGVPCRIS